MSVKSDLVNYVNNYIETVKGKTTISGYRLNIIVNKLLNYIGDVDIANVGFSKIIGYTNDLVGNFVLDYPIELGSIQVYSDGVLVQEFTDYMVKGENGDEISTSEYIYMIRHGLLGNSGEVITIYGVYNVPYTAHLDGEIGGA